MTKLDYKEFHPDLVDSFEDGPLGLMIKHPLIVDIMPLPQLVNPRYEQQKKRAEEALLSGDIERYIWTHERPFRLMYLSTLFTSGQIDRVQLKKVLPSVWSDAEPADELEWEYLFQEAGFCSDATSDELEALSGSSVDLWRGGNISDFPGLAWSLRRETAEFFAKRFNASYPTLWRARAKFNDVYAYIVGRSEAEVVIAPELVKSVRVVTR